MRLFNTLPFGLLLAVLLTPVQTLHAQSFPAKPIRLVVGQGAGGGMDTLARIIGPRLSTALGQSVVVENKVGAGGIIATDFVAKSPADGYSLLLGPIGNMVFTPLLVPKLRYSPTQDFVPVSLVATFPLVLLVNAKLPITTVPELVAYMKANPGEFIQYKSMSETLTALMAGDLLMSLVDTGPATRAIAAGHVRALAVTSPTRLPTLPNVPTMAEIGLPDLEFRYWTGIFAPAGTPPEVVQRLETEINRIVKLPEVSAQMAATQVTAAGGSAQELAQLRSSDLARWGAVAQKSQIKIPE